MAVTDDKAGTLLSGVSLLAGECEPYSATYTPSEANDINGDPTNDPTAVVFSDTATASGTDRPSSPAGSSSAGRSRGRW